MHRPGQVSRILDICFGQSWSETSSEAHGCGHGNSHRALSEQRLRMVSCDVSISQVGKYHDTFHLNTESRSKEGPGEPEQRGALGSPCPPRAVRLLIPASGTCWLCAFPAATAPRRGPALLLCVFPAPSTVPERDRGFQLGE